jgi:hypothetical protein
VSATGKALWVNAPRGSTSIAAFTCGALLAACATERSPWMDNTALVIRPSHHQAVLAFSFGADPPRAEAAALAGRNIAATIAATAVLQDSASPSLDTMDFKGGRLVIHSPR